MDINDKSRIHWACRRGMLELDIPIMSFFNYDYDTLNDHDKHLFVQLLACDDPDLFGWLMNHSEPADPGLKSIIELIRERNLQREPMAG